MFWCVVKLQSLQNLEFISDLLKKNSNEIEQKMISP